jgi:tetratricopeptide (TPR) repeat protein
MSDVHVTFELLEAAERGVLRQSNLFELLIHHLRTLCPTCDVAIQAFLDERAEAEAQGPDEGAAEAPMRPIDRLLAAGERAEDLVDAAMALPPTQLLSDEARARMRAELLAVVRQMDREAERDLRDLRELIRLVDAGRAGEAVRRVRRARKRFRGPALGESLILEVREYLPDRPACALGLARVAQAVAERIDPSHPGRREGRGAVLGMALAHQGNALRALDRLPEADAAFAEARAVLDELRIAEPDVLAEVDSLEGSLRRDQRRFGESERLLNRAAAHWAAGHDALGLARTLLTLGSLHFHRGRAAEALAHAEAALRTLPSAAPARLRLCAEHNRVDYLCDLEHYDVAFELLAEARPLYDEHADAWTRLRLAWVEGRIARGLGEPERAREKLEAARDGFRAADAAYDTALVSLELAQLHLEEGRPADARALAAETVALFRALEVPREAALALAQLERAAREEADDAAEEEGALSAALLAATARALRRAAG